MRHSPLETAPAAVVDRWCILSRPGTAQSGREPRRDFQSPPLGSARWENHFGLDLIRTAQSRPAFDRPAPRLLRCRGLRGSGWFGQAKTWMERDKYRTEN